MSAQRQLRILSHRTDAAERSSAGARSRSAELARRGQAGEMRDPAPAGPATRPPMPGEQHANSPKRLRTLAPMQRPGLSLQREAQEFAQRREQSELSQVICCVFVCVGDIARLRGQSTGSEKHFAK